MSNSLAIAAVTATLRNLLIQGLTSEADLADTTVTMQPLDRARTNGQTANQMNLFLYHVLPSAAWRNMDPPWGVKPGETATPAIGLNLYYLVTAFGRDNDTQRPFSHQLLGRAIGILNDHPLLGADEIKAALVSNDLWNQVERIRITLQPFSVEEIAKLWTGFQTQYRLSIAYEVAVVLIDSRRATQAPLPVLTRGKNDAGILAQSSVLPPFATLDTVELPARQTSAHLGDTIKINGQLLDGDDVQVQFSHHAWDAPKLVPARSHSSQSIEVDVPNDGTAWPAGNYLLAATISTAGEAGPPTNQVAIAIAPSITSSLPVTIKRVRGTATLKLTCSPELAPKQQIAVMLGPNVFPVPIPNAPTSEITVQIPAAEPGEYWIRLRVDGVDSQLVDRTAIPPVFVQTQKVTIK